MTAIAVSPVQEARVVHPRVPLSRITAVETRKMFNTRSGFWLMTSIVVAALLATVAVVLFAPDADLTYSTFGTAVGVPMAVILPMVAILSVTGEWSQRSGLTTFTLVPKRGKVILAKAVCAVAVGVGSMLLAFGLGALGNTVGAAINGTSPVWDVSLGNAGDIVLANVLGLLTGFMLGVLIRSSAGAIVAYFVYSFVLPTISEVLASSQSWFHGLRPWVDFNFAQSALFSSSPVTSGEWANIAVTGLLWLVAPMVVGLFFVMRSEVK